MFNIFRRASPLLLVILPQLAVAQDPPPAEPASLPTDAEPQPGPPAVPLPDADALRAELATAQEVAQQAQSEAADANDQLIWLDAIHNQATLLLDDRETVERRTEAAANLARSNDPRVLAFLRAAAQSREPELQIACVDAAAAVQDPESLALMAWVAEDEQSQRSVRLHTTDVISSLQTREAGVLLWTLAGDADLDSRVRSSARSHLDSSYAALTEELGGPKVVSDWLGKSTVILATANVGGTVLGAVGSFGRYDATAIGATGGALIGGGTGYLVTRAKPVTAGQGLAYLSAAGWGEAVGGFAGVATLGASWHTPSGPQRDRQQELMPAFLAVGSAGGALVGRKIAQRDPEAWDVVEVDVATYLGSALAVAALDVAAYHPDPELTRPDRSWAAYDDYRNTQARLRSGANIVGATGGALVGLKLADRWKLDWEDGLFTGLVAAEASWVGWYWPAAVGIDDTHLRGTLRLPLHGAMIGGLVLAERHPISWEQSLVGGWTAVNGNLLGAGLPRLFNQDSEAAMARVMLPVGLASTIAGVRYTDAVGADLGGWAMVGVGVPLVSANAAVLSDRAWWKGRISESQAGGIAMTATGAAGLGLWAANAELDPEWQDWTVIASGAGWGAYYGALLPIATQSEAAGYDRRLLMVGLTDVGALGAGALVSDRVGVRPIETVIPQLGGIAGGTVSALGVAMFSTEEADLATGAMVGSTVGLLAGSLVQRRLSQHGAADVLAGRLPHPHLNVPGSWSPTVQPHFDSYGEPGLKVGFQGVGW